MAHGTKMLRVLRGMFKGPEGQGWWMAVRCTVQAARKAGYRGGRENVKSHCGIFNYLSWCYLYMAAYCDTYGSNKHNY